MKTGIELEFWVIDEEGRLDYAKPVAQRVYFASQEFSKSMIEIQTEPHEDINELFKELISKTEILVELAKKDNKRIVPLGTPLNSGEVELYNSERFEIEEEVIGPEVRHAGRTAGLHIHFEKQNVVSQLNTLTALDPLSAALNSSPYYQGKPVANGSRNKIYRDKASGKFPEQRALWPYVDSTQEWKDKRSKMFQKFEQEATNQGIEKKKFKTHFQPENSVWTPVKLREDYPTVEFRAPDTTLISEAIKLLKQIKPLMKQNKELEALPDFSKVKKTSEKAINQGLKSNDVKKYLEEFGVEYENFQPLSQEITSKTNLSRSQARNIRWEIAKTLESDLEKSKKLLE